MKIIRTICKNIFSRRCFLRPIFDIRDVITTFSNKASIWDKKKNFILNKDGVSNRLVRILPDFIKPDTYVLDIGTGSGKIADVVKQINKNTKVFASEVSLEMGGISHLENIFLSDVQNMCFKGRLFDTVIAQQVIHHIPDPLLALKEICRILKRDGIFLMLTVGNQYQDNIFPYKQCPMAQEPLGRASANHLSEIVALAGLNVINMYEDFFEMHFRDFSGYCTFMDSIGSVDKIFHYRTCKNTPEEKRKQFYKYFQKSNHFLPKENAPISVKGHYITIVAKNKLQ